MIKMNEFLEKLSDPTKRKWASSFYNDEDSNLTHLFYFLISTDVEESTDYVLLESIIKNIPTETLAGIPHGGHKENSVLGTTMVLTSDPKIIHMVMSWSPQEAFNTFYFPPRKLLIKTAKQQNGEVTWQIDYTHPHPPIFPNISITWEDHDDERKFTIGTTDIQCQEFKLRLTWEDNAFKIAAKTIPSLDCPILLNWGRGPHIHIQSYSPYRDGHTTLIESACEHHLPFSILKRIIANSWRKYNTHVVLYHLESRFSMEKEEFIDSKVLTKWQYLFLMGKIALRKAYLKSLKTRAQLRLYQPIDGRAGPEFTPSPPIYLPINAQFEIPAPAQNTLTP